MTPQSDVKAQLESFSKINQMVGCPPINSSGDIYHVISFIMLLRGLNTSVPQILFSYDTEDTKKQIDRSLNFADALGCRQYFLPPVEFLAENAHRQAHRQCKMMTYLQIQSIERKSIIEYFDQKITTTVLSKYFLTNKTQTLSILHHGYSQRNPKIVSNAAQACLQQYSDFWISKIKASQKTPQQPVIIFHVRFSKDANDDQNLPDEFVLKFKNFLQSRGYCVWYIFTDSRTKGSYIGIQDQRINPFRELLKKEVKKDADLKSLKEIEQNLETQKQIPDFDFGKMKHLQLLLKLKQLPYLKGIIGNTSGTFDLASFLGHNTYNIHNFKPVLAYQDYRILIQMSFSSVEKFDQTSYEAISTKTHYEGSDVASFLKNLNAWLNNFPVVPSISYHDPSVTNDKLWELFCCKQIDASSSASLNRSKSPIPREYTPFIVSYLTSRFNPNLPLTPQPFDKPPTTLPSHSLSTLAPSVTSHPPKPEIPFLPLYNAITSSSSPSKSSDKPNPTLLPQFNSPVLSSVKNEATTIEDTKAKISSGLSALQ